MNSTTKTPVLDKLSKDRVFGIIKTNESATFVEGAGGHFESTLSPDDIRAMAKELINLADELEQSTS